MSDVLANYKKIHWNVLDAKDMIMRQLFIFGAKSEDSLRATATYYGMDEDIYSEAIKELIAEKNISSHDVKYYVTSFQLDQYLEEQKKNI